MNMIYANEELLLYFYKISELI